MVQCSFHINADKWAKQGWLLPETSAKGALRGRRQRERDTETQGT